MKAWTIAVGSELLTPFRTDTNSLAITERLNAHGCEVVAKCVVGDDREALSELLRRAAQAVPVVVCTGGLGPTADDVTREALADAFGRGLSEDRTILNGIRQRFEQRGLPMSPINAKQALVPEGAVVLENRVGTAPGLRLEHRGSVLLFLPGPPREMRPMLDAAIAAGHLPLGRGGLFRRILRITGRTESAVDEVAAPIYSAWASNPVPIVTTILASMGQIELHLTAHANTPDDAAAALDRASETLAGALGDVVYSDDGRSLEAVVGELLRRHELTVAVAESCTGGLLASRMTDVPGSSDYFDRGVVCYSNRAKVDWLGVPQALIEEHGAVSEPVAQAMADGVRARAYAGVGVGITGIAGPSGGTPTKPVGTVAIAVVTPHQTHAATHRFAGSRELVKFQATQAALNRLRLLLQQYPAPTAIH